MLTERKTFPKCTRNLRDGEGFRITHSGIAGLKVALDMLLSQGHCLCVIIPVCAKIGNTTCVIITFMRKVGGGFVLLGKEKMKACFSKELKRSAQLKRYLPAAPHEMSHGPGERWPFAVCGRVDIWRPENLRLSCLCKSYICKRTNHPHMPLCSARL